MLTVECENLNGLDQPLNNTKEKLLRKLNKLELSQEKLLRKLNKLELSISLADNEFSLMYDKVFKPCIVKNNMLILLNQNNDEKQYFIEFMKSKSKSYVNMINYKKMLNDKINKKD